MTTVETIDYPKALVVEQTNKELEPFHRDKLLISVYECLKHRKTAQRDATALTDTIIAKALADTQTPQISRTKIVSITTQTLKRFDKPASVQYAAYHPLASQLR